MRIDRPDEKVMMTIPELHKDIHKPVRTDRPETDRIHQKKRNISHDLLWRENREIVGF
jgi:hypothetical protein